MIADVKRYGLPIAVLMLIVYGLGVTGITQGVRDYNSFAFFALVTFTLLCYASTVIVIAMGDPYGDKIVGTAFYFWEICAVLTIFFVGFMIGDDNLKRLPVRLTLESLWPLSLIIIGAIIIVLSVRGMISLLRTGPNTPKPNGNTT